MIKTITAYTNEIDDIELALEEINRQLEQAGPLLANSVGMITCFADFVSEGVVKELCGQLAFPVVGTTTLANSVDGIIGFTMLTLTVLTSDDVHFSVGLSDPVLQADPELLRAGYEAAAAKLSAQPKLMIAFVPLLVNVGGDFFVDSLNKISGGVPLFGTMAVDHYSDYHAASTIYLGEGYADRLSFILVEGNIEPQFFVASISDEALFREKGVVTASEGNQLQTVNSLPVSEYLISLGLTRNAEGELEGVNSFPFIVDYNDGSQPVVRVMFALTPEGYAVCGGDIPLGATLLVGAINPAQVLTTTDELLQRVLAAGKSGGALFFSCVGRYFAQGFDTTAELQKIVGKDWSSLPYSMCYSGGELCPVYNKEGNSFNRNHNDTFVACVF